MIVRWSGEFQVNVKSQSELDIGGRETCFTLFFFFEGFPQNIGNKNRVLFSHNSGESGLKN